MFVLISMIVDMKLTVQQVGIKPDINHWKNKTDLLYNNYIRKKHVNICTSITWKFIGVFSHKIIIGQKIKEAQVLFPFNFALGLAMQFGFYLRRSTDHHRQRWLKMKDDIFRIAHIWLWCFIIRNESRKKGNFKMFLQKEIYNLIQLRKGPRYPRFFVHRVRKTKNKLITWASQWCLMNMMYLRLISRLSHLCRWNESLLIIFALWGQHVH